MIFKTKPMLDLSGQGLYRKEYEHDNCGIGAVVDIKGRKSHRTVENALHIVESLEHRAGKDSEGRTGDGVGILLQISHKFFKKAALQAGITLPGEREYGVGMFFMPQEESKRAKAMLAFELVLKEEGLKLLGWKKAGVQSEILGSRAAACEPCIMQCFIAKPDNVEKGLAFDRKLYIARRVFEKRSSGCYVASLSSRTIVYKGMFLVGELRRYYDDLRDKDYESAIAIVHSRYSTNTNPSWERAHPNRMVVHNGEINTILGNADKMLAREEVMRSSFMNGDMKKVLPVIDRSGSDSAMLDNTLEFFTMCGMPLALAVMVMIPEPWENDKAMSTTKHDFYEYYSTMMEPWDGPAALIFSDGDIMGATLDRNGLRPSRYYITSDNQLILSSEVGVLDFPVEKVIKKDRLRPGRMLLVDTVKGQVVEDHVLKESYARKQPYGEWLDGYLVNLQDIPFPNRRPRKYDRETITRLQKAFGYTYEDYKLTILTMARSGGETVSAMGVDSPLAMLSRHNPPLFSYFKQRFAQVTNPPIDAIREKVVTSPWVYVGEDGNILEEKEDNCKVIKLESPILSDTDLMKIESMNLNGFQVEKISTLYQLDTSLEKAVEELCIRVGEASVKGAKIVILSDRGVDASHAAIPSLLAVSAVSQYLLKIGRRTAVSLILETGEPRDIHHFATLIGYGATAINPYLVQATIYQMIDDEMLDKDYYIAVQSYIRAIVDGIVKIASKMGISTIRSYKGAKIFEAVGLSQTLVDAYFEGTVSPIGGIGIEEIDSHVKALHKKAFGSMLTPAEISLDSYGIHRFRGGEQEHLYNPRTIHLLQEATRRGDYALFKEYSKAVNEEEKGIHIRGLMEFDFPKEGVPLSEVEDVYSIVKRFKTGAMSYGSISKEAHETLAIAMNRLGGKSNSGEGGESAERLTIGEDGLDRCSAIKQVASGRFGVTSEYLVSAKEIQIKMAQGAKPGEGGHLPGTKVYPWIAKTRYSTPGVSLISPPPHHDIYSIEDLAQLIFDLKNANRKARISVKLVSEAGVGTIAAGVAKGGADVILISGYDGGTGAAPITSIYNAGLPWELGLAETHQTLIQNGLRSKVRVEADGKLMTGRDVAVAAILGAEEFGFATAPLVTMGCVMMRVCNLDTCPMGIATQNPELRKNFRGKPEYVENFMLFIAEELREYMAKLGVRTVDELVGRTEFLRLSSKGKEMGLDFSEILYQPDVPKEKAIFDPDDLYDFQLDKSADVMLLLKNLQLDPENREPREYDVKVSNLERAFGTIFGSEVTKVYGGSLPDDTFTIRCQGSGGQSFGAFIPKGVTLELTGDCNDYLGKGLSGGKIVVRPPQGIPFKAEENIIIGNVAFYGATSGKAFIRGVAGERFCVRNSGITAVVEGVGDHGCEYMTGGRVAILGKTGKNFAAGMSGGIAYVLDEDDDFYLSLNKEFITIDKFDEESTQELRQMIEEHVAATGSEKGKRILADFEGYLHKFRKIVPRDYKRVLSTIAVMKSKGLSEEEAQIQAFYANTAKK